MSQDIDIVVAQTITSLLDGYTPTGAVIPETATNGPMDGANPAENGSSQRLL